ncbi:MAG: hypothetical protein M1828_004458 [Chrysothrix sp. TS-e1954]|nr:MAG: hypothetical protein M1828_004458 [Chrysothrix sp. TS-e1954]
MLTEYLDDTPVPQNRKTSSEPLKTYSSSPIAVATPGNGPVENSPRRSFSFSDLLRRRTSPASTLSQSSSKLRRRPGQRIPSAPTLAMSSGKPQNSINVSPLEGRRAAPNVLSDARASGQNSSPMDQSPTEMRHSKYRRTRQSPTSSDATVSHRGSDYGTRVFSYTDDDDADFASDTVYDSVRTGTTRSTSGARQLGLETLFDRSSSSINRGNEQSSASNEGTSNYASAPSTPKTSQLRGSNGSDHSRTPLAQDHNNITLDSGSVERVKAPEITSALNQSSEPSPSEDEFWDNDDDDLQDYHHNRWPMFDLHADPSEAQDRQNIATPENESRPNLFDWSEQQPVDRSSTDATPPRPKTVHGKKYPDFRGNLSTGRRAPSGLHARSHSVPVLPDLASKRTHAAPKFGTWGIGSKGVTEDWNEDFDFAEEEELENKTDASQQAKSEIKPTILVPESIQKHQTNVLANIGLLREWGLLIEELKDLRMRATSGGLVIDEHDKVFDEVDAMIDLADQEVEDEVPLQSSSPYAEAGLKDIDLDNYLSSVNGTPRGSTNTPHAEIWASGLPSTVPYTESPLNSQKDSPPSIARPRKDSEAVAKSVVEACQQRSIPEGKVPFDTATLRHIVPYVNNLMRKVKQVLREAEGLNTSPEGKWKPALSQAFVEPESPSMSRQQRLKDSMGPLGRSDGQIDDDDVLGHLKLMKLT